ncbi:hypothetical protein CBS101457_002360 [Exobasidium rhododendri]|nr:hypothetical protein CBS101457_002360 [Exobasidium rhododendri]
MVKAHRARKPGGSGGSGTSIAKASSGRRGATSGNGGERVTRSSRAKLTNGLDDPAQVEKELNTQLRSMGLYAANTMGDGNCLFRALSDQLYGYPHQHGILREQVCDYLAERPDKFEAFIDIERPFIEYVRTMRQSGTYGGHLELSAFAQLQQKEIKIVQPGLVYIVSGEDESPQATKERERREKERQIAQNKTTPGTEGPPPSERELRRLRREKKIKGLAEQKPTGMTPSAAESSKMALHSQSDTETVGAGASSEIVAEAYGPLYIAYHNWEHYSSIRNLEGPHTGLPRIKEEHAASGSTSKAANTVSEEGEGESDNPTEEEALVLRSTSGYSLQQIRFYIKRQGGWEEALEAILAQDAVIDDDATEDEDEASSTNGVLSSPDDAARADEAAGPSLPQHGHAILMDDQHEYYCHPPLPDHLRDWRAASPSSVDTMGTCSSMEGGSSSTHATTDESPESGVQSTHSKTTMRSKRAASKDPMSSLRSPKRRSQSRSPMQAPFKPEEDAALSSKDLNSLHVREEWPIEDHQEREPSKLKVSSTKPLTMKERRQARQEEKARKAMEAKNKRRERAANDEENTREQSLPVSSHVRGFLELKI